MTFQPWDLRSTFKAMTPLPTPDHPPLTPEEREKARARIADWAVARASMCANTNDPRAFSFTDAIATDSARYEATLQAVEKERDEADREMEHYLQLALVDPGANPPVSWKSRAESAKSAQAEIARLRKALKASDDYLRSHAPIASIRHPQIQVWNCRYCGEQADCIGAIMHHEQCLLTLTGSALTPAAERRTEGMGNERP